jgi:hypothetical protein
VAVRCAKRVRGGECCVIRSDGTVFADALHEQMVEGVDDSDFQAKTRQTLHNRGLSRASRPALPRPTKRSGHLTGETTGGGRITTAATCILIRRQNGARLVNAPFAIAEHPLKSQRLLVMDASFQTSGWPRP